MIANSVTGSRRRVRGKDIRRKDKALHVLPLQGKRDLQHFIRLPGRLQAADPHWIEPLRLERQMLLSAANPVFEHLRWQGFLAWRDGKPVGRISAQIDQLEQHTGNLRSLGHFGFFDASNDEAVAQALFAAAESWLREAGVNHVTGPFSLTINEESGLLIRGFDRPPAMMMGHAPPYYGHLIESCGYRKAKDLLAYWVPVDACQFTPAMQRMVARERPKVTVRALDRSRFAAELMTLRDIFNDAWQENWGFIPFTEAEFQELGRNLKLLLPDDMIQIAEYQGEAVAFIIGMPNLNEVVAPLRGSLLPFGWLRLLWRLKVRGPQTARVPLMGVRRAHHFSRRGPVLALLLIEAIQNSLRRHRIDAVELSWILEDNQGMRSILEDTGCDPYKCYRVYEKTL